MCKEGKQAHVSRQYADDRICLVALVNCKWLTCSKRRSCYSVGEVEYAAVKLTPHQGLIAGDSEAQQWLSQSRRRGEGAFSPQRPKISPPFGKLLFFDDYNG
jgi:hypothetical protein